jgi:hypothetical protein
MAQPLSSLRLSESELASIRSNVSRRGEAFANKRTELRYALPPEYSVLGEFFLQGGATQKVSVSLRDISRGGLAMLHGNFVHKGTKCMFVVCDKERKPVASTTGEVVRCDHVKGTVHDVGIKFASQLPASVLVRLAGADQEGLEKLEPACAALLQMCEDLVRMVREASTPQNVNEQVRKIQQAMNPPPGGSSEKAAA